MRRDERNAPQGRFLTLGGNRGRRQDARRSRASPSALTDRGIAHVVTREPGGTPLAEQIRDLVLHARDESAAGHGGVAAHVRRAIGASRQSTSSPALAAGRWVICDRFTDATYAYQGAGRGLEHGQHRASWRVWCKERAGRI